MPKAAKPGLRSRRLALEILIKIEKHQAYANLALASAFKRCQLRQRDRAFVTALVNGTLRQQLTIDAQLTGLLNRPLSKLPLLLKNILRQALFQIDHMQDIPDSAVVDLACDLASITGHPGQVRLVNAVLRNYLRQKPQGLRSTVDDQNPAASMSLEYSAPEWLVSRWLSRWGET